MYNTSLDIGELRIGCVNNSLHSNYWQMGFDSNIWSIYKKFYFLDYMGIENGTYFKLILGEDPNRGCHNT